MTNLIECAKKGDLGGIERILDAGGNIDERDNLGRTAAMAATYANQIEAARLLFDRGADPDIRDNQLNNPFLYAGAEGYLEILKLANEAGADPAITNRYGGIALIPASEHGYVETVRYLLEETESDVNHINNLGWTALLEAIILNDGGPNQQDVVKLLIDYDADVDIADNDGVTPLAHARRRGFKEIAELLIAVGANPRQGSRGRNAV
jgi:uncharacterized protein